MSLYAHKLQLFPNQEIRSSVVRLGSGTSVLAADYSPEEEAETPSLTLEQYSKRLFEPSPPEEKTESAKRSERAPGRDSVFSNHARRTIIRAGGAIAKEYSPADCLFLTLTLPGSTIASFKALACYSDYAVQRFKAWIGKRVKGNLSLYVWEYQKRGALHLHYVLVCPPGDARAYIVENLKSEWIRILDAISTFSGVDLYAKNPGFSHAADKSVVQVNCQVCLHSVSGYLSKYLSKGSHENARRSRWRFPPSRWYGVSRPLHSLTRKYTQTTEYVFGRQREALVSYEDSLSALHSMSVQHYSYRHGSTSFRTSVAYFKEKEIEAVWRMIHGTPSLNKSSSTNGGGKGTALIARGLKLQEMHPAWQKEFSRIASPYVQNLVLSWSKQTAMSALDKEHLLDTLQYSLSLSTHPQLIRRGAMTLWLRDSREYLKLVLNRRMDGIPGSLQNPTAPTMEDRTPRANPFEMQLELPL